jgi:amidase
MFPVTPPRPSVDDPVGAFMPGARLHIDPTGSGPLDGLTCGVKDVFDIAGATTGFGSPVWARTHPPATAHAWAVERVLSRGARVVGKTISDELAFSLTGVNHHYGAPLNSAAPDRLTGGSSCGSAAAVAAGLCDFALGTDTAGSMRAPASFCGLFGFRPTHGVVSTTGVCALAPSFDVVGWCARDPGILERVGDVLLPPDQIDLEPSVIHWDLEAWGISEGGDPSQIRGQIARLVPPNIRIQNGEVSEQGLEIWFETFRTLQLAEVGAQLKDWLETATPVLGPGIAERMQAARSVTAEQVSGAAALSIDIRRQLERTWRRTQVIMVPTVPGAAPLRCASLEMLEAYRRHAMRLLCVAGLGGSPQVTLPFLRTSNAPHGFSMITPPGTDRQLLALAHRIAAKFAAFDLELLKSKDRSPKDPAQAERSF